MNFVTSQIMSPSTAQEAIQVLIDGNRRFIQNISMNRNLMDQVRSTSDGQDPFAVVLSCMDSRMNPQIMFDQDLGDLFIIRVAGNIINEDVLGSMEYACAVKSSKVVMVLGHTNCGAIQGACDDAEMGNLTRLLKKIHPAIEAEKLTLVNRNSGNKEFVDHVAKINVELSIERIRRESEILANLEKEGKIMLVGGMYEVETGKVHLCEPV